MRRLHIYIIALMALAMCSCHSKKDVVIQEYHTTDTVYIEKQSESTAQSSFDWSSLGLSFDSLVVVTEPSAPVLDVGDSTMRPPPDKSTKTSLKVFGGKLNYDKASGEDLHAESEKSVETASHQDDKIDDKEQSETIGVAKPSLSKWLAAIAIVLLFIYCIKSHTKDKWI